MLLQYQHHSPTVFPQLFCSPHIRHHRRPPSLYLPKPTTLFSLSVSALPPNLLEPWLAQISEATTVIVPVPVPEDGGPEELAFPPLPEIFATTDDPSPLQIATSVLLTGAIFLFLFRSIRRRIKRAKELRFRSTGAKKTLKDEALESLKAMGAASPIENKKPTSPVQALIGGISAGLIAILLYKFTTTIEASLNRQTISDNFSVSIYSFYSPLLLTVCSSVTHFLAHSFRTIINGLCYLATFVFGFNAIGLILYSGQLTLNSLLEESSEVETQAQGESRSDSEEMQSSEADQNPDDAQ
ncbi:hypothetical protein LINGRAHAP2_LOCUS31933 [Linum grandiflorum]